MGHNCWSATVFAAGIGALAIANEEPRATVRVRRIHRAAAEWAYYAGSKIETKPVSFEREGAFYASVGYASFAARSYLSFRLAWRNAVPATDPADISFIEGTGDFFIHASRR